MPASDPISIRPFVTSDAVAVQAVAERDSRTVPAGRLLVAEVDGRMRAALSLDTGEVVADPFAPSTELVVLLRTRARQLNGRRRRARHPRQGTRLPSFSKRVLSAEGAGNPR
jgi:hypothetical protein